VDSKTQRKDAIGVENYYLADRSNSAVDIIPILHNALMFFLSPSSPDAAATGNNNTAGPNGVMTFLNGTSFAGTSGAPTIMAGDGPTASPACAAIHEAVCSTVKVWTSNNGTPQPDIATGTGGGNTVGINRADELCYDQADNIVLVANDADSPPFDTFIDTNTMKVIGRLPMDGTRPIFTGVGNGEGATNGIEQCQYDSRVGLIYQNIPEVGGDGDDDMPGMVVVFNPAAVRANANNLDAAILTSGEVPLTDCAGPQGMAIGPVGTTQILLGCNAQTEVGTTPLVGPQNSVIISNNFGAGLSVMATLTNQGGSDEVWFEPQPDNGGNYFLGNASAIPVQQLGVATAQGVPAAPVGMTPLQNIFIGFSGSMTTRRSHSVAGWAGNVAGVTGRQSLAIMPISALGGTPVPFASTICDAGGVNLLAQGCIGIFGAPAGTTVRAAP